MIIVRFTTVIVALGVLVACSSQPKPAAAPASPTSGQVVRTSVAIGESFSPKTGDAALLAFVPDVAPLDSGGECSVMRTGGSGATMVTASFPKRIGAHTSATIWFDSAGHLIRFSERRGVSPIGSTRNLFALRASFVLDSGRTTRTKTGG